MAIEVGGKRFVTLDDEFFVNGAKVYEAYANGVQVYPEDSGYIHYFDAVITKRYRGTLQNPVNVGGTTIGTTDAGFEVIFGLSVNDAHDSIPFRIAWFKEDMPDAYGGDYKIVMASSQNYSSPTIEAWKAQSGYGPFPYNTPGMTYWQAGYRVSSYTYDGKTVFYSESRGDNYIRLNGILNEANSDSAGKIAWQIMYGETQTSNP